MVVVRIRDSIYGTFTIIRDGKVYKTKHSDTI